MRPQISEPQLLEALRMSRCSLSLADALASRALSILLHNTAIATARQRATKTKLPQIDHKRRAAGDID